MTARRSPRISAGGRLVAAATVLLAAVVALPASARGQSVEERVRQRELEYEAARSAHDAALAALRAARSLAERASMELGRVRDSDDAERRNDAFATAHGRWIEVEQAERRVDSTAERLAQRREELVNALEDQVEEILARARAADDPEERRFLRDLWEDRRNLIRELEAEAAAGGPEVRFTSTVVPEIAFDPRDGPVELRTKAEFLEHRAALADSSIAEIDVRLEELEERDRRRSALQNFMRGIERFDEGAVPIGREGRGASSRATEEASEREEDPGGTEAASADEAEPASIPERISRLRELRGRLEEFRDQVLQRAQRFRDAVGSVG